MSESKTEAHIDRYLTGCSEYTSPYERKRLAEDWLEKEQRAYNVVADFKRRAVDPAGKRLLDIGFGNGDYSIAFAQAGAKVAGVEINGVLKEIAEDRLAEKSVTADLRLYDGERFPFTDASFDCLFSVSVLEHVSDPRAVLAEAARVLAPGGCFYLAFPNRFAPKETHTGYWFVSYLPRALARPILRRLGRNSIDELNLHFLSYFKLRRLLRRTGLTVRYETGRGSAGARLLKRLLAYLDIHHSILLPHIMVVLDKREQHTTQI
jgi:ubiquinone/menaquinone biosynthesis C-methylase UbiE